MKGNNVSRPSNRKKLAKPLQLEQLEHRQLLAADLVSVSPTADSDFNNPAADIVLTFDEAVSVGAGNITLSSGDVTLETIDVTDAAKVSIAGGVVTINPANDLPFQSGITVTVDEGAINFQSVALFSEGFEDVEMLPFESPSEGGGDGTDWSEEIPEGWERDNTDTPDGGPIEFFGMVIQDKESWIATAGDQARSTFTKGTGNVVVADGDEYDDGAASIGPDQMNVFLTTPEISLDGVAENAAVLEFDSSFRPEVDQTALVDVSFDGGATWNNLLSINEDNIDGGRSSLARANIRERLPLSNPANAEALIRFGYVNAGNNWWWAFDNVAVEVPGEGESFAGTSWDFETSPDFEPDSGAIGATLDGNLSITFAQDVVVTPGLGDLTIYRAADDSVFEVIPMASDRVNASGQTVTIDPVSDLEPETEYYVTVDNFTIWDTEDVNVAGITLFSEDFEGLPLQDSGLVGGLDIDDYVIVMSGKLEVTEAGVYTFGGNSDDGQLLAIDVAQDGFDVLDDEIFYDNTTHGTQVRLSTCGSDDQSCVEDGGEGIELAEGEYEFEYWYFERSGGSSGEFFYGQGDLLEFDADEFVLVGDDSKGIGIAGDGVLITTYVSALEDPTLDVISDLERAALLVEGQIARAEGFPAEEVVELADVWNTGGTGRFSVNNPLPGFEPPEPEFDWSASPPEGWEKDTEFLNAERPGGPEEYLGWTFFNKDFWIAEQGDQSRSSFTNGKNVVALVDPDAYDDFVDIDSDTGDNATECVPIEPENRTAGGECGYFSTGLSTAPINVNGLAENTATLSFDSSWRDETTQSAQASVEYFDGDGNSMGELELFRWESINTDDNYKAAALNETLDFALENPEDAASIVVTFTMPYAQNDWWWAIDNVRVTSPFSGNPLPGVEAGIWSFTTGTGGSGVTGDINGDDVVDFSDFIILSTNFNQEVPPGTLGDFNNNGTVDFADFIVLSTNYNPAGPEAAAPAAESVDLVFASADDDDDDDEASLLG